MKPEFKIGQLVTFKPYGEIIPAKVIGIEYGLWPLSPTDDDRIFYILTGAGKKPLKSKTTGRSIVESKLFEAKGGSSCVN